MFWAEELKTKSYASANKAGDGGMLSRQVFYKKGGGLKPLIAPPSARSQIVHVYSTLHSNRPYEKLNKIPKI